jgi:hypothetical protein
MVKLTAPFHALTARGTLADLVSYKTTRGKTTAGRKPRMPRIVSPAMARAQSYLKFIAPFVTEIITYAEPGWTDRGKTAGTTARIACLKENLARVPKNLPIRYDLSGPEYTLEPWEGSWSFQTDRDSDTQTLTISANGIGYWNYMKLYFNPGLWPTFAETEFIGCWRPSEAEPTKSFALADRGPGYYGVALFLTDCYTFNQQNVGNVPF